jgi:hypothetical protein
MKKRKFARARQTDERETSGAIDFDAALEACVEGGDPEELLQAAGRSSTATGLSPRSMPRRCQP